MYQPPKCPYSQYKYKEHITKSSQVLVFHNYTALAHKKFPFSKTTNYLNYLDFLTFLYFFFFFR